MNETIYLDVPKNVNYLSNWKDLDKNLKEGHIILNKKITGCGATSYFLNHPSMKVILASPRVLLLQDKYKKGKHLHWFRKEDPTNEDIQQDVNIEEEKEIIEKNLEKQIEKTKKPSKHLTIEDYKQLLRDYVTENYDSGIRKILVTYDSIGYVLDTLKDYGENLDDYTIVVDEFHSIFQDSRFKAEVELNFVNVLQSVKNVIYLSATPILKKFTDQMVEFKDLPYYEIRWPEEKLVKANISRIKTDSLIDEASKIVNSYLLGLYPSKVIGGEIIESREAVFFFNSVLDIIRVIKRTGLTKDQVNILCAKNSKNIARLRKINKEIGFIPEEGKEHKMFTFCTRTSFLGTDFYSTCASTYIFANPNIDSLSIDVSMDLPQIIGRQRLETNPFRYDITLFYKTIDVLEDFGKFEEHIHEKEISTNRLMNITNKLDDLENRDYKLRLVNSNKYTRYSMDYVGFIWGKMGKIDLKFNKLVYFSEFRSWDIQQKNFKDDLTMLKTLEGEGYRIIDSEIDNDYTRFYNNFTETKSFEVRMKLYCEFVEKYSIDALESFNFIPSNYHLYYKNLGWDRIRALSYKEKDLKNYMLIAGNTGKKIKNELMKCLKIGDRRTLSDLKGILKIIYEGLKVRSTPKAIDINNYFEVKRATINKSFGYEIVSYSPKIEIKSSCSIFDRAYKTEDSTIMGIDDLFKLISSDKYKNDILEIRSCDDKNKANDLKFLNLPIVCWNGIFTKKRFGFLTEYSSYIAIDLDNFENEADIAKSRENLMKKPYVKAIFITPSGKGLKAIIQHNNINPDDHRELFRVIAADINDPHIDLSVCDIARGNYISWDPYIYIRYECNSFEFFSDPEFKEEQVKEVHRFTKNDTLDDHRILGCLDSYWEKNYPNAYDEGNRHNSVLKQAAKLCRAGIAIDEAKSYLISKFTLPGLEVCKEVDYIYQCNKEDYGKDRDSFELE
jgi:hypothetical protein